MNVQTLLLVAAIGAGLYVGAVVVKGVDHGAKKAGHAIVHVLKKL